MSHTLIIGLGNPGEQYRQTRHNVGFMVVDALAGFFHAPWKKRMFQRTISATTEVSDEKVFLIKPTTFMNRSGEVLPSLLKKHPNGRLIIITDNMDLEPGQIRIKQGGTAGGHNGMASILQYAKEYPVIKVYVGIGRPTHEPPRSYVLHAPVGDDAIDLSLGVDRARDAVIDLLQKPLEDVMHEYNRKKTS